MVKLLDTDPTDPLARDVPRDRCKLDEAPVVVVVWEVSAPLAVVGSDDSPPAEESALPWEEVVDIVLVIRWMGSSKREMSEPGCCCWSTFPLTFPENVRLQMEGQENKI